MRNLQDEWLENYVEAIPQDDDESTGLMGALDEVNKKTGDCRKKFE